MTPPGNESFTRSGKFSTLRKLFTKRRARPSLPIQYPLRNSEDSATSNVPLTMSFVNQDPEQRNSDQIQNDANITLRIIESVLLVSEELDALISHRQALDSLAAKFKDALGKVQQRTAANGHQVLTARDEQTFIRIVGPVTADEQNACNVTWKLISLLCKMVGFDVMTVDERDRKEGTRTLVQFLLKLGFDQEYRSSASNAQKQLFEKVAKLCTQYVNECKPDAKDDVPNGVTPGDATEDAAPPEDTAKDDVRKDDAPKDDRQMDDVSDGDALDHDAFYHNAPKQVGENIVLVAGQFSALDLEPRITDAMGNTQKQILAEISKLWCDFLNSGNDREVAEMNDTKLAALEIRCLAREINLSLRYILAKVEMKPVNQRRELIPLVEHNVDRCIDECRKDVKRVEENHQVTSE
ncbi:hypothetical protein JMJ35_007027 [Cladonia borealis]|uniref:Uncharacterized protein n=1 Tax=Cladonia borealis TaxID=184061 RepID=A0AA39QWQ2_9LECA|nr:hypothetical protein JMJ35_007027 [Cladonia borealis]